MMSFEESIEYLDGLYRLPFLPASQVRLERVNFLLSCLGNPHRAFRSVHVAGSCGKGSTTSMVGSILQHAGFHTGCFRSPHLVSYTERVAVDGEDISHADWARHFAAILPVAEGMRTGAFSEYELGRPTLFELLFALASLHFAEAGVEWAAIETGLGGRLDATNTLQPDVAVVTNVSLEHTQVLGNDVETIAREKAAIIKPGCHTVTAAEGVALGVIEERARTCGVPLLRVGRDVAVAAQRREGSQQLLLEAPNIHVEAILTSMAGFQVTNAATAFGATAALRDRGIELSEASIRRGLEQTTLPGRYERISSSSNIILDGAHNAAAIRALSESLAALRERPDVLLFAAMDDKDIEAMAATIGPHIGSTVVCPVPGTTRSASLDRMTGAFRSLGVPVESVDDAATALRTAQGAAEGGSVLVAGSLYLVGFVRQLLRAPVAA